MRKHVISSLVIVAVNVLAFSWGNATESGKQIPTATEIFQLRSLCARLGDQLLEGTSVGSTLMKDQSSHYEPRSNRCYVELTVTKISPKDADDEYVNRTVYDGQTRELLAFAKIEKGRRIGMIFDKQHRMADPGKMPDWVDASDYIDERMLDDRNQ